MPGERLVLSCGAVLSAAPERFRSWAQRTRLAFFSTRRREGAGQSWAFGASVSCALRCCVSPWADGGALKGYVTRVSSADVDDGEARVKPNASEKTGRQLTRLSQHGSCMPANLVCAETKGNDQPRTTDNHRKRTPLRYTHMWSTMNSQAEMVFRNAYCV